MTARVCGPYNHGMGMTTLICDHPMNGRYQLWGDTPDEALLIAAAVGHDLTHGPNDQLPGHYLLTADQRNQALALGVVETDCWGPAYWCAQRRGDTDMLGILARTRSWARNT